MLVDSWRGGRKDGDGDGLALPLIVMGLPKVAPGWGLLLLRPLRGRQLGSPVGTNSELSNS